MQNAKTKTTTKRRGRPKKPEGERLEYTEIGFPPPVLASLRDSAERSGYRLATYLRLRILEGSGIDHLVARREAYRLLRQMRRIIGQLKSNADNRTLSHELVAQLATLVDRAVAVAASGVSKSVEANKCLNDAD